MALRSLFCRVSITSITPKPHRDYGSSTPWSCSTAGSTAATSPAAIGFQFYVCVQLQVQQLRRTRSTKETRCRANLNEKFGRVIQDYLESRGMTSSSADFVLECMIRKDTKEYLRCRRSLKALIEQK